MLASVVLVFVHPPPAGAAEKGMNSARTNALVEDTAEDNQGESTTGSDQRSVQDEWATLLVLPVVRLNINGAYYMPK